MYDALHELADDYSLPHVVKKGIKGAAEVHKYTYCNMLKMKRGAMRAALPPIMGQDNAD